VEEVSFTGVPALPVDAGPGMRQLLRRAGRATAMLFVAVVVAPRLSDRPEG
jgi:hypothetical protein